MIGALYDHFEPVNWLAAALAGAAIAIRAWSERHGADVAALAEAVARRMRLPEREVDDIRLAAELCNVGTVAVPDGILRSAVRSTRRRRSSSRRHAIVGERILAVAPSLARVARLVRSSRERQDGGG